MNVIATAASQYANRPKDESFADIPAMLEGATFDKINSKEVGYNLRDLEVKPIDGRVMLASPKGMADFSHWSFGQFATMVKAPASYLRTLPPANIASDLNFGIQEAAKVGQRASLLVRAPKNGTTETAPILRAATTEKYDRVWDADFYKGADDLVFQQASTSGQPWIAPPTWQGDAAGTWRGDRDSFVIRVDGGSIVTDPSVAHDGQMYRGIMLRNSEVGGSSILIEWVLFQYICGNLSLWGAVIDRRFRRRHVGSNTLAATLRELGTLARQWTQRSASQDETIIRHLINTEVAHTPEGVMDELKAIGYTKEQAKTAVDACERHFKASPRSVWGLAQGTTKASQQVEYQNERYAFDQLAAKLMSKHARAFA